MSMVRTTQKADECMLDIGVWSYRSSGGIENAFHKRVLQQEHFAFSFSESAVADRPPGIPRCSDLPQSVTASSFEALSP